MEVEGSGGWAGESEEAAAESAWLLVLWRREARRYGWVGSSVGGVASKKSAAAAVSAATAAQAVSARRRVRRLHGRGEGISEGDGRPPRRSPDQYRQTDTEDRGDSGGESNLRLCPPGPHANFPFASNFFPSTGGLVWFSTYQTLVVY